MHKRAERLFKKWNGRTSTTTGRVEVPENAILVRLGTVPELTYDSDKEGKELRFNHKFEEPPVLYAVPGERILMMVGGNWKIGKWFKG